ncbi:phosphotransferase enzyme family protein [Paenibacillus thailandensis]|uniref:Phosphotransferase enzyme family protein n=1 Tax=Paenibacillus thailandensis TaxID=393250 RepID=A0ABW5QY47_9BACL
MLERMPEAAEIAAHMKRIFGRSVAEAAVLDKGWLNVKWRMETEQGPVFVKYYHPDRYKLHARPERRSDIERTLRLQHELNIGGVPCPNVHAANGRFLQETPSGLFYTVQDWIEGQPAQAGCLNTAQMHSLGLATGRMHKRLRAVPPLGAPVWRPDKARYVEEWEGNWNKARQADDGIAAEWLERSRRLVEAIDFGLFDSFRPAWLHWDLWVDNLLLNDEGVAGILDFDEAPPGMPARAMLMLYLVESIWWLRTEIRAEMGLKDLLRRFVEELHWIEDNRDTLAEQLPR